MSAAETLKQIAAEVAVCTLCNLSKARKKTVPGEGPANSEILFIGEGPGMNEDEQGRPFVGAAGKLLDQLLAGAGLKREEVWIGNVVKCRPPDNRDPMPEELAACDAYLERQIQAIHPSIIVTLGRFSMSKFMPGAKISAVHGQMRRIGERFVIAMYHPAAGLHQPALMKTIMADFSKLPQLLSVARKELAKASPTAAEAEKPPVEPKQLNLF